MIICRHTGSPVLDRSTLSPSFALIYLSVLDLSTRDRGYARLRMAGIGSLLQRWGVGRNMKKDEMKTKGQMESEISESLTRFEKDHMGRGPLEIRTTLFDDVVFMRMRGVLTPAERQLVEAPNPNDGLRLIKRMRTELLEGARPLLDVLIARITGCQVVSMHTDISTVTGERILVFMLDRCPDYREPRKSA